MNMSDAANPEDHADTENASTPLDSRWFPGFHAHTFDVDGIGIFAR